jgi:CMP-2-keto-3-deoxyoctulosonic acid synthetase
VCILINSKRKKPWIVPHNINKIVSKLKECNIENAKDLFKIVNNENELQKINIILESKNLLGFSKETFNLFLNLFKNQKCNLIPR